MLYLNARNSKDGVFCESGYVYQWNSISDIPLGTFELHSEAPRPRICGDRSGRSTIWQSRHPYYVYYTFLISLESAKPINIEKEIDVVLFNFLILIAIFEVVDTADKILREQKDRRLSVHYCTDRFI